MEQCAVRFRFLKKKIMCKSSLLFIVNSANAILEKKKKVNEAAITSIKFPEGFNVIEEENN